MGKDFYCPICGAFQEHVKATVCISVFSLSCKWKICRRHCKISRCQSTEGQNKIQVSSLSTMGCRWWQGDKGKALAAASVGIQKNSFV